MKIDRFKFRYWHQEYQEMQLIKQLQYYENHIIAKTVDDEVIIGNDSHYLMACTGLCDKNGALIYEGDIVKQPWGTVVPVKFIGLINSDFGHNNEFTSCGFIYSDDTDICPSQIEIIGHIFQPEWEYLAK